ncbi:hypothetical protein VOI54_13285 [Tamlana sp. 2201CG12-4]|uniref:hypothetical protein n=1 Tax=Tamlana sp. 2201CG12-4 TaxID=3112582 RepID=UPI002DBDA992|nr:hypothetical protein [Tamlana sp. 2201CG12-4]MEC3907998.1 hypothetical protein [Tamlana sp. 2201CG12-4]
MKTKLLTTKIKFVLGISIMLTAGILSAQQTTGDVAKKANIEPGVTSLDGSIRVIDNKGTIKFLQVKNGLTLLTNTTNDITTTTWQLGGTLTDDTIIDVDGNAFVIDGIELETGVASTDAADQTAAGSGATGWTLLVRDEATGKTRKMLATDLLQSGHTTDTAASDTLTGSFTITTAGMPADASRVWVYRNGAKLISGTDYTAAADTVTINVNPGSGNANWVSFTGDVYEVHWVK